MPSRTRKNIRRSEQRQLAHQIIASASPDTIEAAKVYLREQEALASDRPASTKPPPKRNHKIAAQQRLGKAIVTIQNMTNSDANANAIVELRQMNEVMAPSALPIEVRTAPSALARHRSGNTAANGSSPPPPKNLFTRSGDNRDGGPVAKRNRVGQGGAGNGGSLVTSPSSSSSDSSNLNDLPDDFDDDAILAAEAQLKAQEAAEVERVAGLKAQLKAQLKAEEAAEVERVAGLKAKLEAAEAKREAAEEKRVAEAQLKAQEAAEAERVAGLKAKLEAAEADKAKLQGDIGTLVLQRERAEAELDEVKKANAMLNGQLDEVKKANAMLNGQLDEVKKANAMLNGQLDEVKKANAMLNGQLDEVKKANAMLNGQLDEAEIKRMKEECGRLVDDVKAAEEQEKRISNEKFERLKRLEAYLARLDEGAKEGDRRMIAISEMLTAQRAILNG